jgi:hypothetical protein
MAAFLHLLKRDSPPLARAVIAAQGRDAGACVTVVLLGDIDALDVPPGVTIRRLAPGRDLDYSDLLDLIFEADHVLTW